MSIGDLANLLIASSAKDKEYYLGILDEISKLEVSEETSKILLQSIITNKRLKEISLMAYDVTEGRADVEKFNTLLTSFMSTEESAVEQREDEFVTDDLEELANGTIKHPGLRWRLDTLNKMLGSLRKGDFGFIFARPETGKTTFLASEVTFMAEQLGENSGPIIWLNNEEQGSKVKLRCYQASLGLSTAQLLGNLNGHAEDYRERTRSKLKIFDSATIHKNTVLRLCKQYKPSLLIFDQIDKIQGFDNDREDLRLGAIYMWARELAKEFCPVIGVCQSDGTGEGVKWLTMAHVANAKTAKQAEADWILGIGKIHDAGYENLRFLHASKNKLLGDEDSDPNLRHGKREVLINAGIARYEDI